MHSKLLPKPWYRTVDIEADEIAFGEQVDLMLPGLELCQTLRAEGRHLPMLMLSARSNTEDKATACARARTTT